MLIRSGQDEFLEKVVNAIDQLQKLQILCAIRNHPIAFFYIIALRLTELLTILVAALMPKKINISLQYL